MKKRLMTKSWRRRLLSLILVCCLLAGMLAGYRPSEVKAADPLRYSFTVNTHGYTESTLTKCYFPQSLSSQGLDPTKINWYGYADGSEVYGGIGGWTDTIDTYIEVGSPQPGVCIYEWCDEMGQNIVLSVTVTFVDPDAIDKERKWEKTLVDESQIGTTYPFADQAAFADIVLEVGEDKPVLVEPGFASRGINIKRLNVGVTSDGIVTLPEYINHSSDQSKDGWVDGFINLRGVKAGTTKFMLIGEGKIAFFANVTVVAYGGRQAMNPHPKSAALVKKITLKPGASFAEVGRESKVVMDDAYNDTRSLLEPSSNSAGGSFQPQVSWKALKSGSRTFSYAYETASNGGESTYDWIQYQITIGRQNAVPVENGTVVIPEPQADPEPTPTPDPTPDPTPEPTPTPDPTPGPTPTPDPTPDPTPSTDDGPTASNIVKNVSISYPKEMKAKNPTPKGIYMSQSTLHIKKGAKKTLKLMRAKSGVKWKSTNKKVASVSKKGVVSAKKVGKATIKAVYKKKTYTCKVTVKKKVNRKLSAKTLNLAKGKSRKLTLSDADVVTWSTSAPAVATVSAKGVVTAKGYGMAKIRARSEGKVYSCMVTVARSISNIKNVSLKQGTKSANATKGKAATIGNVSSDGYSVTIPKETFDKTTKVSATVKGSTIDLKAGGKDNIRLGNSVRVRIKLQKKVPKSDLVYYKAAYIAANGKEYLIDPDPAELSKGYVDFTMDHFTKVKAKVVSVRDLTKDLAFKDARNEILMNQAIDSAMLAFEEVGVQIARMTYGENASDKIAAYREIFTNKWLRNVGDLNKAIIHYKQGKTEEFTKDLLSYAYKVALQSIDSEKFSADSAGAYAALPEVINLAKSGNYMKAAKTMGGTVTDAVSGAGVVKFIYSTMVSIRSAQTNHDLEMAVLAAAGEDVAGFKGEWDISKDEDWENFKSEKGMSNTFRNYIIQSLEDYRVANYNQNGDQGMALYGDYFFYHDDAMKAEREQVKAEAEATLRRTLITRVKRQKELNQIAQKNEAEIEAYLKFSNAFNYDDSESMTEEEYLATVTRCREIRSTIEAMMGGKTPAQLEGYPKGESERINNMRYAQLVGIWLKDWRDEDGSTNENGRQRVLEWLAQNYGLGLKVELDTDNFGIGGFSKVTVWLESTDITSKTKLSTFNKKCATIDKNGNIKAVSDGAGNITISYGKIKIKKKIVVGEGNLHLNPKGYNELTVGDTQNMSLRTENSSNVQGTPKWTSSNTSVLTVTHSGKVSAKKAGKATITCTYHNQEYKKSFTVEARVELDYRSMTLVKGNSKKLTLLGADGSKVRWGTKGGAGVVSLSKTTGKTVTVSARSAGKATVVASYKGKNYTCSVKVKNPVKKQTVVGSYEGSMTYYDRGLFGDLRQTLTGSVYISISKASEDHCRQYGCEYTGKEYEVYWNMRGQDGIKIKGFSDDRSGLVIVKGSSTSISANTKYGNTHVSASGGSVSIQYYLQKEDGSDKLLVVNARGKKMKK